MQKCDACHKPAWVCAECLKEVETPKTTNADRIRSMSDEELAKNNVRDVYECDIDYDYEDNPTENWVVVYKASDGSAFCSEQDAIAYELDWLRQPAEEEAPSAE